jgi:Cytochrome P450
MTIAPVIPYDRLPAPLSDHPYLFVLTPIILLIVLATTRIVTTLRFHSHAPHSINPPTLPYSFPFLGHIPAVISDFQAFISASSHRYPTQPAFALQLGNTKHNVLLAPSLTHQLLTKRDIFNKVNMHELIWRVVKTFGGDHNEDIRRTVSEEAAFGSIHGALSGMMREEFVTTSLRSTVDAVQDRIIDMVSGLRGVIDMERWERAAQVEILDAGNNVEEWTAEANLFYLIRGFVTDLTLPVLMGREFLVNYPGVADDVFTAEKALNRFVMGIPEWFPNMHAPVRARNRLVAALQDHRAAYLKYAGGDDPGTRWGDMDDVSSVMRDRAFAWRDAGVNAELAGRVDAMVLIAFNINAPYVIFWMVWYIFSDAELLQDIREEVAPYFKMRSSDEATTGSVKEKEKPDIDLDGLRLRCPLLQGVFAETLRLESQNSSYKYVNEDVILEESEEDAVIFGRSKDDKRTYVLRKGEYAVVPHGVHQVDPRYFAKPHEFDARRFLTTKEKATNGEATLDYKTMKPWGGGKEICKGKKFAEGEALVFAAAIVAFWNVESIAEKPWYAGLGEDLGGVLKMGGGEKGAWKHPGRDGSPQTSHPKDVGACRVKMWRRDVGGGGEGGTK